MSSNPVVDYLVARDLGWLLKSAFNLQTAISGAALATAIGGIGVGEWQRRKIRKMEDKRELVGAINDTMSRRRLAEIYELAGMPAPHIPLAVSKRVSPEYKKILGTLRQPARTALPGRRGDSKRI